MKSYPPETINACKRLFVEQGFSAAQIAQEYNGSPSKSCVQGWSKKKDTDGLNWYDYRQKFLKESYDKATPDAMARKILEQINTILAKSDFNSKDADSLAKLQKALEKITDPRYQVPVMYHMLSEFVTFAKGNYPHLVTEDFINCIRDYKNNLRSRLEKA